MAVLIMVSPSSWGRREGVEAAVGALDHQQAALRVEHERAGGNDDARWASRRRPVMEHPGSPRRHCSWIPLDGRDSWLLLLLG
jgi:hypothetical protein